MHFEKFRLDQIQNGRLLAIIHFHNVRFWLRIHFENFRLDQIQNGRLSAIIHFHMAVILQTVRWLDHYYITKCEVSWEDAP